MSGMALTADQVAAELEYFHRDGTPNGDVVRSMYRSGEFPAPIDPVQPVQRWRWARVRVEQYVAGEWPKVLTVRTHGGHVTEVPDRGAA